MAYYYDPNQPYQTYNPYNAATQPFQLQQDRMSFATSEYPEHYLMGNDSILPVTPAAAPYGQQSAPTYGPDPTAGDANPMNQMGGLLPAAYEWFSSPIPQYYQGALTPSLTPRHEAAYEYGVGSSLLSAANALGLQRTYADYLGEGPQMDPYVRDVVDAYASEMNQAFAEQTLPAIQGKAISAGGLGGSRQALAEALATEELTETIGNQTASLLSAGYENAQDRYLQALTGAPNVYGYASQAMMAPSELVMNYGEMERSIQQQQAMDDFNEWLYYSNQPLERLQAYSNLILPYAGIGGTSGLDREREENRQYQYL